jgi:serine/threonine-protein kinase RsbT
VDPALSAPEIAGGDGTEVSSVDIRNIKNALDARILAGESRLDAEVEHIYASDLMSDVLAFGKPNSVLFTGLATQQAVISAHMAEFKGVVFVRGKRPKDGSSTFARDHDLVLLSTHLDMYEACVRIGAAAEETMLAAGDTTLPHERKQALHSQEFSIQGGDFGNAGMVSTQVKSILNKIGLDPKFVRRIAISTYEGEMNVVMHAERAVAKLSITPALVEVTIKDEGSGIPDIELAMQEGYSTATEEMRAMGFGSGMGLSNIKKQSDEFHIESTVNKGTTLHLRFNI